MVADPMHMSFTDVITTTSSEQWLLVDMNNGERIIAFSSKNDLKRLQVLLLKFKPLWHDDVAKLIADVAPIFRTVRLQWPSPHHGVKSQ